MSTFDTTCTGVAAMSEITTILETFIVNPSQQPQQNSHSLTVPPLPHVATHPHSRNALSPSQIQK